MNAEKFIGTLTAESQKALDFIRSEGYDKRHGWDEQESKEQAVSDALDIASAELSMQQYATAVDESGAGQDGFTAKIAAYLK